MPKITPIPSDVFTARNKSALVKVINSLWDMQIDTVTQKRVIEALELQGIPNEWLEELTDNIDFFINEQFEPVLATKTVKAGTALNKKIEDVMDVSLDYTLTNNGLAFIDNEGLGLSIKLNESLRLNVSRTLRESITNGWNIAETKRAMSPAMTLTNKGNKAVQNFASNLPDDLTAKQKAKLIDNYFKKLQRNRSETIARTELTRVKHFGEIDSLNQNMGLGKIKGATKIWNRANFKDNWESSIINDGVEVGINEAFPEPCATGNDMYPSEISEYCYLDYGVK